MGRSRDEGDVPKTVLIISGSCDNDFVVFEYFDIVFCKNSYVIIVTELSDRDEKSSDKTVQNVALLRLLG